MTISPIGWAAVAGLGVMIVATPEGQRKVRHAASTVAAVLPKPAPSSGTKPPTSSGGTQPAPSSGTKPAPVILPAGLEPYRAALKTAAMRNGMRWTLLAGLCTVENAPYDPRAFRFESQLQYQAWVIDAAKKYKKSVGELSTSYGLAQVLGVTAYSVGFKGQTADLLNDPALSLEMGARYWLQRYNRWKSTGKTQAERDQLALIAYNGGDGAVKTVLNSGPHSSVQYAAKVLNAEQQILKGLIR